MSPRLVPLLTAALAASFLAACAPDAAVPPQDGQDAAVVGQGQAAIDAIPALQQSAVPPRAARVADAIAGYPDRGDLVGYNKVRRIQRQGAHTFYPVEVSEDHALAAIGTGTLRLTGPDGRQVELDYDRHVEHANGDWSWIGHDANGVDGILTFGEKAVFGVLPYGSDDSLRLTTQGGQAWMATTAKDVLSPLQQRIRAGLVGPDYRLPPRDPADAGASGMTASASSVQSIAAQAAGRLDLPVTAAAAGTTLDLLLGYTAGFASMMGGTSQAQTRLNHLVTVGNQTFTNSSVDVELRLVGTMQVNYPDTGSNQTALHQLTGSNGSSNVSIPASLQPLRAARETLGADMVSLVRRFRDADHEGCGIAWLIGGAQTAIVAGHERFAYSAISDSNGMLAPDNGHYCRDETLIHELGHNLGSQHDVDAARGDDGVLDEEDYGRYPWSFGLKTSATNGNFYTVMSYGDTGQTGWRIFSNPQSTFCGGRACGVANQADNARSLRLTAPIIASFRGSMGGAGARADVNGDGRSDVVWRHAGNGQNAIWLSGSRSTQQGAATVADLAWKLVGAGDFTGDGRADLLWRNEATGANTIWPAGNRGATIVLGSAGSAWKVVGIGDFDGDGKADILWRNTSTGANDIWRSGTRGDSIAINKVADLNWTVAGVGDFNGDGRDDIVWRNTSNGQNTIWPGAQRSAQIAVAAVADQAWKIVGVGDFDGDGEADLLWRKSNGDNVIWRSGSRSTQQAVTSVASQAWTVAAVGDYNGDGRADIFWRNTSTGANTIWPSASRSSQLVLATVADQGWQVLKP